MEKNDYLKMNDLLYYLYTEPSFYQLKLTLLQRLKLFIPYKYSSILMLEEENNEFHFNSPVCNPLDFMDAELKYLRFEDIDHTNWQLYSKESVIIRESELINDAARLNTPIYKNLYSKYNIFDTLQMSIVYEGKVYAIITLYRTHAQGVFTPDDVFFLNSLSKHLNFLFYRHIDGGETEKSDSESSQIAAKYKLTPREAEILSYIFEGMNNNNILDKISVSTFTLQKHIQNIYRKTNVSSRFELLTLKKEL